MVQKREQDSRILSEPTYSLASEVASSASYHKLRCQYRTGRTTRRVIDTGGDATRPKDPNGRERTQIFSLGVRRWERRWDSRESSLSVRLLKTRKLNGKFDTEGICQTRACATNGLMRNMMIYCGILHLTLLRNGASDSILAPVSLTFYHAEQYPYANQYNRSESSSISPLSK